MAGNTEKVQEPTEMVKNTNSCSGCGSEINAKADIVKRRRTRPASSRASEAQPHENETKLSRSKPMLDTHALYASRSKLRGIAFTKINKDPIADRLLRLCAIINGTWNDILASIQSISFLRNAALYIDCTILAVWKRKKTGRNKRNR